MTAHTPGPWTLLARPDHARGFKVTDADGEFVSYLPASRYHDERRDGEAESNARLMAAAPDLLAALQTVTTALHSCCLVITDDEARKDALEMVADARAAIAKARGESY